jgi:hypothetical protein
MGRRRNDQGENLDSLLDTMANVVGILVVLVAFTQLSVGDAVERIRSRGADRDVGVDELELALAEKEDVDAALDITGERWRRMSDESNEHAWLIDDSADVIATLAALPERNDLRGLGSAELEAELEQQRALLEQQIDEAKKKRVEVARLDEFIDGLPAEDRPKIARLPDPRPPPRSSKQVTFFCRYGQVMAVEVPQQLTDLDAMIALALGPNRDRRHVNWEDRPFLDNFFAKQHFWRDGLRWTTREFDEGRLYRAEIVWQDPTQGEGMSRLRRTDSDYLARLRETTPKGNHIHFWVWSDSYEVYLEARYLAERLGYAVSWLPLADDEELGFDLAGTARRIPSILID